jgi:hypothetical protein
MIRYKIKNNANGLEFVQTGELNLQPEHGKPARTEINIITPESVDELGNVTPAVTEEIHIAAEYTIVEEDISAEIAALNQKEADRKAALATLQGVQNMNTATTAQLLGIMKAISKILGD